MNLCESAILTHVIKCDHVCINMYLCSIIDFDRSAIHRIQMIPAYLQNVSGTN